MSDNRRSKTFTQGVQRSPVHEWIEAMGRATRTPEVALEQGADGG